MARPSAHWWLTISAGLSSPAQASCGSTCGLTGMCISHKTRAAGIPKPAGTPSLGGGGTLAHMSGALCPQVWRSDVHFAWKHVLCPDGEFLSEEGGSMGTREMARLYLLDSVSHRHLGLLILALLALTALVGVVLVLLGRRLLPGKITFGRGRFRWSQHFLTERGPKHRLLCYS